MGAPPRKGSLGNLNYIFDFDLNHLITRVTDLGYSLKNNEKTILCAEVTSYVNNENLEKIIASAIQN